MHRYQYVPFPKLRRQYRREKELKETILSSFLMISVTLFFTLLYLFL